MKNQHVCFSSIKHIFLTKLQNSFLFGCRCTTSCEWISGAAVFSGSLIFHFTWDPQCSVRSAGYIHFYIYSMPTIVCVSATFTKKPLFPVYFLVRRVCESVIAEPNDSHAYTYTCIAKAPQRSGAGNYASTLNLIWFFYTKFLLFFNVYGAVVPKWFRVRRWRIMTRWYISFYFLHMTVAGGSHFFLLSCSWCVKFCNCHAMDTCLTRWYDTISDRTKRIRNTDNTFQFEPTQHIRGAGPNDCSFCSLLSSGCC